MSEPEIESSSLIHISRQKSSSSSNHIFPPEKSSQFEAFSSDPLNATKVGGADWQIECSEQISLKVPNVDFDFDVCVDSILFLINTYIAKPNISFARSNKESSFRFRCVFKVSGRESLLSMSLLPIFQPEMVQGQPGVLQLHPEAVDRSEEVLQRVRSSSRCKFNL